MISGLVQQGRHALRRWMLDPALRQVGRYAAHTVAGFLLSAASLEQGALTLVMGLVWASHGLEAVLSALGGCAGYWIFWGQAGVQGQLCALVSLAGALLLGSRRISRELPLLIPSVGMLTVSAVGLGFQLWAGDTTPVSLYLIRVALGGAAPWLFSRLRQERDPVLEWISWGLAALALAQVAPVSWLGLGFVAAGAMSVAGAFPCAAVTGLALDIARITSVPMTAVTVLSYLVRFLPALPKSVRMLTPSLVGLLMMQLCGLWSPEALPGLFLGGLVGIILPGPEKLTRRRGQTGAAQVQLELAASVLARTQQLLMEVPPTPIDRDGLVARAAESACAGCSARAGCRDVRRIAQLPGELLNKPLLGVEELPLRCRKSGRFLAQLHRGQEQLRSIRADRERQREYREAVVQQYRFLSGYLQELSDRLSRREETPTLTYEPVVCVYGNRAQNANADRCLHFSGSHGKYYVVLCDGMGTGPGAVQESRTALDLLHRLLCCGFPAEHALRSLNSLCALRERAGAVTVDLAEISLHSGKTTIYKWGAVASWLVSAAGAEKLGHSCPPPGISVTGAETSCRLTLRREQLLLLVSDGLSEPEVLSVCRGQWGATACDLATALLDTASNPDQDDTTVVTVQLIPAKP